MVRKTAQDDPESKKVIKIEIKATKTILSFGFLGSLKNNSTDANESHKSQIKWGHRKATVPFYKYRPWNIIVSLIKLRGKVRFV